MPRSSPTSGATTKSIANAEPFQTPLKSTQKTYERWTLKVLGVLAFTREWRLEPCEGLHRTQRRAN